MAETIQAKVYRGMPRVELTEENNVVLQVELTESVSQKVIDGAMKGPISISLESLDVDLQHNQSFGMVSASTGCISNPGGPGC